MNIKDIDSEALRKIKNDLAWRGPTGRTLGHVIITRSQAEELVLLFKELARFTEASCS